MLFPPEKGNSSTEAAEPNPSSAAKAEITWFLLLGCGKPELETNLNTYKDRGGLFLWPQAAKLLLRDLQKGQCAAVGGWLGRGWHSP